MKVFCFCVTNLELESDAGKNKRTQSRINLETQILLVKTEKHQEAGELLVPNQGIILHSCRQSKELNLVKKLKVMPVQQCLERCHM